MNLPTAAYRQSTREPSLSTGYSAAAASRRRAESLESTSRQSSSSNKLGGTSKNARPLTPSRNNEVPAPDSAPPAGHGTTGLSAGDMARSGARHSWDQTETYFSQAGAARQKSTSHGVSMEALTYPTDPEGDDAQHTTTFISALSLEKILVEYQTKMKSLEEKVAATERERDHQRGIVDQLRARIERTIQVSGAVSFTEAMRSCCWRQLPW